MGRGHSPETMAILREIRELKSEARDSIEADHYDDDYIDDEDEDDEASYYDIYE